MCRLISILILAAVLTAFSASSSLAICDKDMLAGIWERQNVGDPPLKTATYWTFTPEYTGADKGAIECTGDCLRALGAPLSYELNQPTMMSRMKVKFEKERSIYFCKIKVNELILGPMKFSR